MLYFCCKVNHYVPADATSEVYDSKDNTAFSLSIPCALNKVQCVQKRGHVNNYLSLFPSYVSFFKVSPSSFSVALSQCPEQSGSSHKPNLH